MSYLPRMSKTYKEPDQLTEDEDEEENLPSTSLKPASSILNDKTYNPQTALKHYKYVPHAPPVLPGPSVLEEVMENELFQEASRMKRSLSKMESIIKTSESIEVPPMDASLISIEETESRQDPTEKTRRIHSRKGIKANKSNLGKKRSSKVLKKDNTSNATVNVCLMPNKPFTASELDRQSHNLGDDSEFLSRQELDLLKREKSLFPISSGEGIVKPQEQTMERTCEKAKVEVKEFTNRGVQCTIFGSTSKMFVIPPIINSLLRTLTFLLHEINKEDILNSSSGENKYTMAEMQLILADLCNQKLEKDYSYDVSYSDFKRLEKILGEFKKYMKDVYGDKGDYIDKMEDLKRVFIESKSKEMELAILTEKLQDREEKQQEEFDLKEEDLKTPEIMLQNTRLENEQLAAEVEFGCQELRKYRKSIAQVEWDIRNCQEQMASLKKSAASKSKGEVLGRKGSVHKFSSEIWTRRCKSRDSDSSKKKT